MHFFHHYFHYWLHLPGETGFKVALFDISKPLVQDPLLGSAISLSNIAYNRTLWAQLLVGGLYDLLELREEKEKKDCQVWCGQWSSCIELSVHFLGDETTLTLAWLQIIYLRSPFGFECWLELVGMTAPILIRPERTRLVYLDLIWVSSISNPSALLPNATFSKHKHKESFGRKIVLLSWKKVYHLGESEMWIFDPVAQREDAIGLPYLDHLAFVFYAFESCLYLYLCMFFIGVIYNLVYLE